MYGAALRYPCRKYSDNNSSSNRNGSKSSGRSNRSDSGKGNDSSDGHSRLGSGSRNAQVLMSA